MRCDECDYDYDSLTRDEIAPALRACATEYRSALSGTADRLRQRPQAHVWSPLEYACHVRDVLRVQRERVLLALVEDTPEFVSMRRDERVTEERYNEQDPAVVAGELAGAADALAGTLDELDDAGWARTGVYNYPTKEVRTVEWIGRHTVHEASHHARDIRSQLAMSRNARSSRGTSGPMGA